MTTERHASAAPKERPPAELPPIDDLARDYLLLGLSLGAHIDGLVDAYYGPPELRAAAEARRATPGRLVEEAVELRARAATEPDGQRRQWLDRQLIALETLARRAAGEEMPYSEEVERHFDATPHATAPEAYSELRATLDDLLPGSGPLQARLAARDARLNVPPDRLESLLNWVVEQVRALSAAVFAAPVGESLTVSLVTNEPWAAYNWYDGGLRSRIEFNVDLPTRAHHLVSSLGHETFPGHHLEHSWKEQRVVRDQGRIEASLQLINTPEAYISEGLAEVGPRLLVDAAKWQELLIAICEQAGIPMSAADAQREWDIAQALRTLRGSGGDAALQLHTGGRSREQVKQFLVDDALRTPALAEKSLEFLTHPLWRTYVFCYAGGEQLLTRWCEAAGDLEAQRKRFFRLLTEQLTPSGIAADLAQ